MPRYTNSGLRNWCIFFGIIAAIFFQTAPVVGQEKEKEKEPFVPYKLKFGQANTDVANLSLSSEKFTKIEVILAYYNQQMTPEIKRAFLPQGTEGEQPPSLSPDQMKVVMEQSQRFFQDLEKAGLNMKDIQTFQSDFNKKTPDRGASWNNKFLGVERMLMGGRVQLVNTVWQSSLIDYLNTEPGAAGVIYGQMDIGSWANLKVNGLGFPADIDFSVLSTDDATNKKLVAFFEQNLKKASGLTMVQIDALLTAHGQAKADVFIGEWGRVFAEVSLLKQPNSKIKIIQPLKDEKGNITGIGFEERNAMEVLVERCIDQEDRVAAEQERAGEKLPEITANNEPMLSLEMLRHGMHDIEKGPFAGVQKIIKITKYAERSFAVMEDVENNLKKNNITFQDGPGAYVDIKLKELCSFIKDNKKNEAEIIKRIEDYTGLSLGNEDMIDLVEKKMTEQCKSAMLANAHRGFTHRALTIAAIPDDRIRMIEADRFITQLTQENSEGFYRSNTPFPESMAKAINLMQQIKTGTLSQADLNKHLETLNKLMQDAYKVEPGITEKICGDAFLRLRSWMAESNKWKEATINEFIKKLKDKYNNEIKGYTPEALEKAALSTYDYAKTAQANLTRMNNFLEQSGPGKLLNLKLFDALDNYFAFYDAYQSGKTPGEAIYNMTSTGMLIYAQQKIPFLAVPMGFYNAYKQERPGPAVMAVTFYYFPMVGQVYMVTTLTDRMIVTTVRDANFQKNLDAIASYAVYEEGKIIRFKVPRPASGWVSGSSREYFETDDISDNPVQRSIDIKKIFNEGELNVTPEMGYFYSLVPTRADKFGLYETKLDNLAKLFSFDDELMGLIDNIRIILKDSTDPTSPFWPRDQFSETRNKQLAQIEDDLENGLWLSIANAVENMHRSVDPKVSQKYKDELLGIEKELWMGNDQMKKRSLPGLLVKVENEIKNDPNNKSLGTTKYGSGAAFEKVAIPTYEKYLNAYKKIIAIREQIFNYWAAASLKQLDNYKAQSDPLTGLLAGDGAPSLTGDIETDLKLANESLKRHAGRADKVIKDLTTALGRPIDEKKDREHLKILCQLAFEFEHLNDAKIKGKETWWDENKETSTYDASLTGAVAKVKTVGAETEVDDVDANVVEFMAERRKAYQEYLKNLKASTYDLDLMVEGPTTVVSPGDASLTVKVTNRQNQPVALPEGTFIEWYEQKEGLAEKMMQGAAFIAGFKDPGKKTFEVRLMKTGSDKPLAQQFWTIEATGDKKTVVAGTPTITLPDKVTQFEIVEATLSIPPEWQAKLKEISVDGDITNNATSLTRKLQFKNDRSNEGVLEVSAWVFLQDEERPRNIRTAVTFEPRQWAVTASDAWEGGCSGNDFGFRHKGLKMPPRSNISYAKDPAEMKSTAGAGANVSFKPVANRFDGSENLQEEVQKEFNPKNDKSLKLKAIKVAGFEGYVVGQDEPAYKGGAATSEGFYSSGAIRGSKGYIKKGAMVYEVSFYANTVGWYDESDKDWQINAVNRLYGEAESILLGATLAPKGGVTFTRYKGPALDGSEDPLVTIEPKPLTMKMGETKTIRAIIKNDKPEYGPYSFSWGGQGTDDAKTSAITLTGNRPGKYQVSVNVTGTVSPGSASMEYVVEPAKINLRKTSPASDTVSAGMPVSFQADITGLTAAGTKLSYQWQPHPEEKFEPHESGTAGTKVVFSKPGTHKVWVQVLDKGSADAFVVGESQTIEVVVVMAGIKLEFNPKTAMPGQQVTAKVVLEKPVEGIRYQWEPIKPDLAKNPTESSVGDALTFIPAGNQPIEVAVKLVNKENGDPLGEARLNFTASRYKISTEGPKAAGPTPMIWKEGIGLVEDKKAIAVDQVVEFKAVAEPVLPEGVTYQWTVKSGEATISNPTSRDARITAGQTGTIVAEVIIKGKENIVLGTALATYQASISAEEVKTANLKKKAFDSNMLLVKEEMAKGNWKKATELNDELLRIDPKTAAPITAQLVPLCTKAGKDSAYQRNFPASLEAYEKALQYQPGDANLKARIAEVKGWQKQWPAVIANGEEIKKAVGDKNLPVATELVKKLSSLQTMMPGGTANRYSLDLQKQVQTLTTQYNDANKLYQQQSGGAFKNKEWQKGLEIAEQHQKEWVLFKADADNHKAAIATAKMQLGEQEKTYQWFLQQKKEVEAGRPPGPNFNPQGINFSIGQRFPDNTNDPRVLEMLGYANNMITRQEKRVNDAKTASVLQKETTNAKETKTAPIVEDKTTASGNNKEIKTAENKKKGLKGFLDKVNEGIEAIDKAIKENTTTTTKEPESPAKTEKTPENAPKEVSKGIAPANPDEEEMVWDNWNKISVGSAPSKPTVFTLNEDTYVSRIENYHYQNRGVKPGTIGLKSQSGKVYGPWQAHGMIGQGGVMDAVWIVRPNTTIPAGTYTLLDSDNGSWSQNSSSGGAGFSHIMRPKKGVSANRDKTSPVASEKSNKLPEDPNKEGSSTNNDIAKSKWEAELRIYIEVKLITVIGSSLAFNLKDFPTELRIKSSSGELIGTWKGERQFDYTNTHCSSIIWTTNVPLKPGIYKVVPANTGRINTFSIVASSSSNNDISYFDGNGLQLKQPDGNLLYDKDYYKIVDGKIYQKGMFWIEGNIYRPDGQPADGAVVYIPSKTVSGGARIRSFTDVKGHYALQIPMEYSNAGKIVVMYNFKGHHKGENTLNVTEGKTIKTDIHLPKE